MKDKVAIKKIIIQVGDKELALTLEAARELRDALNDLLDEPKTTYVPYPVYREPYRYWGPTWVYSDPFTSSGSNLAGQSYTFKLSASGDSDDIKVIS